MRRYTLGTLGLEIVMIIVTIIFSVPFFIMINLSLRGLDDQNSALRPTTEPHFENYVEAWNRAGLGPALFSSVFITATSVLVILVFSALAAYYLARVTRRFSRITFVFFMIGLLLPIQLGLLPLYINMRDLQLLGTHWSLIIYYIGLQMPFAVFVFTGFMRALPRDYEEAAMIDGCGPLGAFRHAVVPMLKPVTTTIFILNTIWIWNDFFTPLLYLSGTTSQTIPVAMNAFVGQYYTNWPVVFAGFTIGLAPILVLYFLMQRQIVSGFGGGLKG